MTGFALPNPPDQPGRFCLALTGSLCLGLVTGSWTLLRPAMEALETRRSASAALEAEIRQQQSRISARAELEAAVDGLASELRQFQSLLPTKNDLAGLLASLAASADRHGLMLERFQPGEAVSLPNHHRQPLTVGLRGDWPGLMAFLAGLHQELGFLQPGRMEFTPATTETEMDGLRLELSLEAIWQADPGQHPPPPDRGALRPAVHPERNLPGLPASLRLDPFRQDRGLPTYLGRIETNSTRWGLLRGPHRSIHRVRAGDELQIPVGGQRFRVNQIKTDALYLQFADAPGPGASIRLPLTSTNPEGAPD